MEKNPSTTLILLFPMETSWKILRKSIHNFLRNYQYFTTTSLLLAFPFSAALLLTLSIIPSSPLLFTIHHHLNSLFQAAGIIFPPSNSQLLLFTILNLKISQTITSTILVLPFTLSFLLISKASIIHFLNDHQQKPSFVSIYNSILVTQIWNSFLILSANATCFSLLFVAFNCLEASGRYSSSSSSSAASSLLLFLSAILYSVILANSFMVCNLALVTSGMDKSSGGGYLAILKACVLMRGRTATALALAIPVNMALAAVEALFQYRVVVRAFYSSTTATATSSSSSSSSSTTAAFEGIFIAYLYSIIVVIDTIVSCEFFKSCKRGLRIDEEGGYGYYGI